MGIPDHLTCLLRNLYAGQEATVRTGHGTTGWFQIWVFATGDSKLPEVVTMKENNLVEAIILSNIFYTKQS